MNPKKNKFSPKAKIEIEKMMSGELYDATHNETLLELLNAEFRVCERFLEVKIEKLFP